MLKRSRFPSRAGLRVFFAVTMVAIGVAGFGQGRDRGDERQARTVIERTNNVLNDAQGAVQRNRIYTGDLAAAYSNEDYARELFRKNQFHNAIEHSLYARRLAYQTLAANHVRYRREVFRDEIGFSSRGNAILFEETRRGRPDGPHDDRAASTLTFDFHL